jgi:Spy/CpxP family protein refolding chaperone
MKRTLAYLTLLVFSITIGTSTLGSGLQTDDRPKDPGLRADGPEDQSPEPGDSSVQETPVRGPQPFEAPASRRTVSRLTRLREEIKEKLDLTAEQEKQIGDLVDDHIRSIEEQREQRGRSRIKETDLEELKTLRNQMKEARKTGDTEAARRIRTEMTEKARSLRQPIGPSTSQLIEKIAGQLEEGQLRTFEEIVRRFRLDDAPHYRGGPLRTLLRAVRDPELALTDEQRREVRETVRRTITAVPPDERRGERMDETAKKLQAEISELLTAEQRAKLEAALKAAERPGDVEGKSGVTLKRKPPAEAEGGNPTEESDPKRAEDD